MCVCVYALEKIKKKPHQNDKISHFNSWDLPQAASWNWFRFEWKCCCNVRAQYVLTPHSYRTSFSIWNSNHYNLHRVRLVCVCFFLLCCLSDISYMRGDCFTCLFLLLFYSGFLFDIFDVERGIFVVRPGPKT